MARRQLLAAGIAAGAIDRRIQRGTLLVEYPGVYRVGHRAPSVEARYMAAVLACGDGALVCGRAAAHLWRIVRGAAPAPEVMAPTERRIEGIVTVRARKLDARDAGVARGIPCTSVARTVVDLAAVLPAEQLALVCHEAGVRYRMQPEHVEEVLERRPTTAGAGTLRRVLRGEVHVTLSVLERRFLTMLRNHGFPQPVTNRPAGGRYVDCRWPDFRLTVELDSYRYHATRWAWEQDRRRERQARARGDEFRRYTYGDVCEDQRWMLRELGALLPRNRPA